MDGLVGDIHCLIFWSSISFEQYVRNKALELVYLVFCIMTSYPAQ